jgi:hypothetical protein
VRIGGAALVAVCLTLVMSTASGAAPVHGLVQLSGTSHSEFSNPCNTTSVSTTGKTFATVAQFGPGAVVGWLDQEHGTGYELTQLGGGIFRTASTTYTFQGQAFFTNPSNYRLDFRWTVNVKLVITTAANGVFHMYWTGTHGVCDATSHWVADPPTSGGSA